MKIFKELLNLESENIKFSKGLSQRGIGDLIENHIYESCRNSFNVRNRKSKKSLEDFSVKSDKDIFLIDVKSHNVNASFCMPNLTSVKKIHELIQEKNLFLLYYIFVNYSIEKSLILKIEDIKIGSILHLDWKNLQIANLGLGQLQIKDMHNFRFLLKEDTSWVKTFYKKNYEFYLKQSKKMLDLFTFFKEEFEKCTSTIVNHV